MDLRTAATIILIAMIGGGTGILFGLRALHRKTFKKWQKGGSVGCGWIFGYLGLISAFMFLAAVFAPNGDGGQHAFEICSALATILFIWLFLYLNTEKYD